MIVLDEPTNDLHSAKRLMASSSRVDEEYVDDTVPYTQQLDEALSTDLEHRQTSTSSSSSASIVSTERPAPLPPSYEASIGTSGTKGFSKHSRRRRYIVAIVLLLYLVVSIAVLLPWMLKRKARQSKPSKKDHHAPDWVPPPLDGGWPPLLPEGSDPSSVLPPPLVTSRLPIFSVPGGPASEDCTVWKAEKSTTPEEEIPTHSVSQKFPLDQSLTFSNKNGRGSGSAGSLRVRISDDTAEELVVMDVTAKFIGEKCKKEAKVCLRRLDQSTTVQFDVIGDKKKDNKGWSPVLFDVVLTLPRRKTHIQNMTTQLSFFEHNFDDLRDWVTFDMLTVEGHFSPFGSKGITARDVHITSSLKAISGKFNVSDSISLATSLAPIDTDISLMSNDKRQSPVAFSLTTSNAPINGQVRLGQSLNAREKPRYSGVVTTANGAVDLAVTHLDTVLDATLNLMAETSLDPITLYLDPYYQGGFNVKSKVASANVVGYEGVQDPTGWHRQRIVSFTERSAWGITGWVGWSERPLSPTGQSHIELSTELSDATLLLTQTAPGL